MKEIQSEIEIGAPAAIVWKTLVDFQHYSDWNPFIHRISGTATVGEKIQIWIRTPGGKERKYAPVVSQVDDGRELRWLGKSFLLEGEHSFSLQATSAKSTRFVQTEVFRGLLAGFFGKNTDNDIAEGFQEMNRALKGRAERSI